MRFARNFWRQTTSTTHTLMNTLLDFFVYAGTLVAASAVGGVCFIGLIVWLAGGESHDTPKPTK